VLLLTRRSAARYEAAGNPVGERFRHGWDAFDRHAPAAARALVGGLTADPSRCLRRSPGSPTRVCTATSSSAIAGIAADGTVWLIDWQMTLVAPVAVELGWFLVCNVAGLPVPPDEVLDRYRRAAGIPADNAWARQRDLALVVGLLLRGWRKGLDADAGLVTACGWTPPPTSSGGAGSARGG
jgi:hypothetical protein